METRGKGLAHVRYHHPRRAPAERGTEAAADIQKVAAEAKSMKKLKFDLGNNHAMVVAPDADLDALCRPSKFP